MIKQWKDDVIFETVEFEVPVLVEALFAYHTTLCRMRTEHQDHLSLLKRCCGVRYEDEVKHYISELSHKIDVCETLLKDLV